MKRQTAQSVYLPVLLLLIFSLATYAVHFSQVPYAAGKDCKIEGEKDCPETLWAMGTWSPTTTFTMVLAVMALGQAALFFWQLGLIREGAADATKAANAAVEQGKLARRDFLLVHRPRLRVRNFYLSNPSSEPLASGLWGQFYLVNIGGTDASVVHSHIVMHLHNGPLPQKRPYEGVTPNERVANGVVKVGTPVPVQFGSGLLTQTLDEIDTVLEPRIATIMGFVEYADGGGNLRKVAFCRTYDPAAQRFERSENEDYEHEE